MKNLAIISVIALFFFGMINFSCEKNTDCKATITCIDSVGNYLNGAKVQLYATVKNSTGTTYTADLKADGVTDGGGQVKFTFKLPAIMDIKATMTASAKTYSGSSIIKLEEGKGADKTVTLR
jgi:hypothetical protein